MRFQLNGMIVASAFLLAMGTATIPSFAASGRDTAKLPIGVQMYSLRNDGTFEDQLKAVDAAGITAIEIYGSTDLTAQQYKKMLDDKGLTVTSAHVSLDTLRGDMQSVVDFNKTIGNHVLVMPYIGLDQRPADETGWQAFGIELAGLADALDAQGMQFVYHNHNFEMVEYNGRTALEILMDAAGPKVMLELDVSWAQRAGQNPSALLTKFKDRLFAIHAKDNGTAGDPNSGASGFVSVGSGTVNWMEVLPAAYSGGVKWYIIEHDNAKDTAASIKASAAYLTDHIPAGATR